MFYLIPLEERKKAKSPHELFVLNLIISHIFAAPASIALNIGLMGFLIPLSLSLTMISVIYWRSHRAELEQSWFIASHWRLAKKRTKILLIAYAISLIVLAMGFFIAGNTEVKTTQDIMLTIFTRLAVVPVLISVMICFVLESGAIYQSSNGEVPDRCIKNFPAPDDLPASEQILVNKKED